MSASTLSILKRVVLSVPVILLPLTAQADKFTAGAVMEKMSGEERYTFVAGIVEGLAIARYMQDGKKPDGMNCIYNWIYQTPKTIDNIYQAFSHFPDYPPGSVIDAMTRKTCT